MARKKSVAPATNDAPSPAKDDEPVAELASKKKPRKKRASKKKKKKAAVSLDKATEAVTTKAAPVPSKKKAASLETAKEAAAPETTESAGPRKSDGGAGGLGEPTMWASHQFHQFATTQLDAMYRFTREKLVALMTSVYNETDGDVIERNVQLMLGKKPIRIRKIKDPDRPSKPLTGYQIFCRDFHADEKKNGTSKKSLIDLSKEQSKRWRELGETKKKKYLQQAATLKEEYKSKLEIYNTGKRKSVITPITV